MNRLCTQPQLEAALFRSLCGKIGDIGGQAHVFKALVRGLLEVVEIPGEIHMCSELAISVQLPFQSLRLIGYPLLFFRIPAPVLLAHYFHFGVLDWLTKKIVGSDFHTRILTGKVVGAVGMDLHRVRGKLIAADADLRPGFLTGESVTLYLCRDGA